MSSSRLRPTLEKLRSLLGCAVLFGAFACSTPEADDGGTGGGGGVPADGGSGGKGSGGKSSGTSSGGKASGSGGDTNGSGGDIATGGHDSGSGGQGGEGPLEPIDGCDLLEPIGLDDSTSNALTTGQAHCYVFTVMMPGTLQVILDEVSAGNVHLLVAKKPTGDTLGDMATVAGDGNWYANTGQLEKFVPLPPDTYLIKVHSGNATYKLTTLFGAVETPLPEDVPGDKPSTAAPLGDLTAGEEVALSGYVGPADKIDQIDYDLYEFEVMENGTLRVLLDEVSAGNVHLLVAKKPTGDTLGDMATVAGDGNWYANTGQLEKFVPLPPGTYLIKVHSGNATYRLTTSFAAVETPRPEDVPGDLPSTAAELGNLTAGEEVALSGYVGPADKIDQIDYDLYEFEVMENGTLRVLLNEVSAGNVHLLVAKKPTGDTLGDTATVAGDGNWYANTGQLEKFVPLPPGTYLIKVHSGNATYKLTTSFDAVETPLPDDIPGDLPSTAAPLGDLTAGEEVALGGYVGPADKVDEIDYDLYEFEVMASGSLHVILGNVSSGNVHLLVANKPSGDTLGVTDTIAGDGNWYANTAQLDKFVPLVPGTYLIKVHSGNATYKLTTSFAVTPG